MLSPLPSRDLLLRLETMTYGGAALGHVDGKVVFVTGGLPGEVVRVVIEEDRSHFARARLIEVIEPAPERVTPRCPHFGWDSAACGGCHWQHIDYAAQLRFKTGIVREQLQRLARLPDPPVRDILPSPAVWQYRNHAQFHRAPAGRLGFQAARSHRVVPIDECLAIAPALQTWLQAQPPLEAAHERRVNVRCANRQSFLSNDQPSACTFYIKDAEFRVSPESFFQVNTALIETLVDQVIAKLELRGTETILDAYCGVGLFSRFLAPRVARVIGVESSASARLDFESNLAGFANVEFHLGRVENNLPALSTRLDAALLDPPRAGCGPLVIDAVVARQIERVVIVSCDPATLARDVRQLLAQRYTLIEVQPIDLFPHTYHIETIAVLQARGSS